MLLGSILVLRFVQHGPRLCPMFGRDGTAHGGDRRRDHCGIIPEAEQRQEIRDAVDRHDEIGQGRKQDELDAAARGGIAHAEMGRERILRERQRARKRF